MPGISLTDFVDFVIKSGPPKMTKVKEIKNRGKYEPFKDFWRKLRKGIVDYHSEGQADKKKLDKLVENLTDKKKANRYPEALKAYKKFLGRKKTEWFDPPTTKINIRGLEVRVNPELGLEYNGQRRIIKLYFKSDKLTKSKSKTVLAILEEYLRKSCRQEDIFSILDVNNSKIIDFDPNEKENILPLLEGEAASFVVMWDRL